MSEIKQPETKDYTKEEIKQQIQTEYKKIDKYGKRDDKEIYQGALKVIDNILQTIEKNPKYTILKNKDGKLPTWITSELSKQKNKIQENIKKLEGYQWITSNEITTLINTIASEINKNEERLYKKLERAQENRAIDEANKEKLKNARGYYTLDQYGAMLLTKKTNQPKIHEVLEDVIGNAPKKLYEIDYTNCQNSRICEKMRSIIGGNKCYVRYDKEKKTYLLQDSKGNTLADVNKERALVWEGVVIRDTHALNAQRLAREDIAKKEKLETSKKQREKTQNLSTMKSNEILKDKDRVTIIDQLPDRLKGILTGSKKEYLGLFLQKTETRLNDLLADAAQEGYSIASDEPISKLTLQSGLMELHLVGKDLKKDIPIWYEGDKQTTDHLPPGLYQLLDDHEDDLKTFLTTRVLAKKSDFSHLEQRDSIFSGRKIANRQKESTETTKDIGPTKKQSLNYGLNILQQFIENARKAEGDSIRDHDDQYLVACEDFLKNTIYSIQNTKVITPYMLEQEIIAKFTSMRNKIPLTRDKREHAKKLLPTILQGKTQAEQIQAMRALEGNILDHTNTSFLTENIINDTENKLVFNDVTYNQAFQKIDSFFSPKENGTFTQEQKNTIDYIANNCKDGWNMAWYLEQNKIGVLPPGWRNNTDLAQAIVNKLDKVLHSLKQTREHFKNNPITLTEQAFLQQTQNEYDEIIKKGAENISEEERAILQVKQMLINDPHLRATALAQANSVLREEALYGSLSNQLKHALAHPFAEHTGGTNNKIFDDILGVGWCNLSDENGKFVGEMAVMIAQEVAFMAAVMALTATTGVGGGALIAARTAITTTTRAALSIAGKSMLRMGAKVALSSAFRSAAKLALTAIIRGTLHTTLSKAVKGKLDDGFSTWMEEVLQRSAMYGVLQGVSNWANSGKFAAFSQKSPTGFLVTKAALEDIGISGSDVIIKVVTNKENALPTTEEFITNFALAITFELFAARLGKKIKPETISKENVTFNTPHGKQKITIKELKTQLEVFQKAPKTQPPATPREKIASQRPKPKENTNTHQTIKHSSENLHATTPLENKVRKLRQELEKRKSIKGEMSAGLRPYNSTDDAIFRTKREERKELRKKHPTIVEKIKNGTQKIET